MRSFLASLLAATALLWLPHARAQDGGRTLFLVAKPGLPDPNFRESVVLVTQNESGETGGVIINRPTNRSLASILPGERFKRFTEPVFFGGPGEPGLTVAEKIYGWNSFIVLAMVSGRPENPVNAVAPNARAHCQIRYTVDSDPDTFAPALRKHLDEAGFPEVRIENPGIRMPASRTDPAVPWVCWTVSSMERTLGRRVQVIPNSSGGLPGDVFVDHLGVKLIWVPHSYNGCKQHGPDEHFLIAPAREGIAAFAGIWWDLGDK